MKRTSFSIGWIALLALLSLFVYIGCKGDAGPAGPAGSNPQGPPIITAVVAVPDSIGAGDYTTLVVNAYDPNGDALTYAWSASVGSFSSPTAAVTNWSPPDSIALYVISVAVTDDDGTVNSTVMVGVNAYVPATVPSYLGTNPYVCAVCHDAKLTSWLTTPHSSAFADSANIALEHRTTGYDPGIDNGGYDDNPGPWLRNVQCEACHGPLGPEMGVPHTYLSETTFTGEACGQCHTQYSEYQYSAHGTAIERAGGHEEFNTEWNRSSCWTCHISEAFIKAWDTDWSTREIPHLANQVSCGTCHDPHASSEDNPAQLRTVADFLLVYGGEDYPTGYTVTGWGSGQLCGQCHHARRTRTTIMNAINNGAQRANPHESPQADMIAGRGSYEIPGFTYERGGAGDFSNSPHTNSCVSCHMEEVETPSAHSNHNFHSPASLVACDACHDPDKSDVKTEIVALLDQLAQMLPNATQGEDGHWTVPSDTRDTLAWTRPKREAGWAWQFVHYDNSDGVHNYDYAHTLLENAIDHLTP